ncbi:MAG: hypothetical protein ACI9XO_001707 [Paraglaciecola sp.]|jgi:hypothetical protein
MKLNNFVYAFLLLGFLSSCSDLEEELSDTVSAEVALEGDVDVDALLAGVYNGLQSPYQDQAGVWAASQFPSDETLGPTRGPDWDDNGVWRVLHDHTWDADHAFLGATFNSLLQLVYSTSVIIEEANPTPEQAAEARFLRAFAMFTVLDGWNQVPFRENLKDFALDPIVFTGNDALDFIISEVEKAQADLPDGPASRANKNAAKVLLMKAYLNKGVIANRANPSFETADMTRVVALADEIIDGGNYSLAENVFDNFAPNNGQISTENIFTDENVAGQAGGSGNSIRSRWFCSLHYNQNPSGWNGFTTLSAFYDSFEDGDMRKYNEYPGIFEEGGVNSGFLIGQQFDADGVALQDRKGNPLSYTREVALVETGANLEVTGIRPQKYPIDYANGDNVDNDAVLYRYADVLLMKAEALLRNGNAGEATSIVNEIRTKRMTSEFSTMNLEMLLDERGRELYWEAHRRQDLIRFGKFLDAWENKPATGEERLLFPIPNTALATNPNLMQNPGY